MRIKNKFQLGNYKLIQNQILQTNITKTVLQKVRRITNEILGVKGLSICYLLNNTTSSKGSIPFVFKIKV